MDDGISEFFFWFREAIQSYWDRYTSPPPGFFKTSTGSAWVPGTEWLPGPDDATLDQIANTLGQTFPPEFRAFLQIVGTPSRGVQRWGYKDKDEIEFLGEFPLFTRWESEGVESTLDLQDYLLKGTLFDVENEVIWPRIWGPRPSDASARAQVVQAIMARAPVPLPILGHRYLLPIEGVEACPVLSQVQTDVIIYGEDLPSFLLREFSVELRKAPEPPEVKKSVASFETLRSVPYFGDLLFEER